MNREEILATLATQQVSLRRMGVQRVRLFGSLARGEATPESDVDLLVTFPAPPTFDQYMDVKIFLEDLLGRRVDLVTDTGLRDRVRPYVEAEAILVA